MKKTQDEHASHPSRFLAAAGELANLTQLVLRLDLIARVRRPQAHFRGFILDNRQGLEPCPRGAAQLRHMKIAQENVEIAFKVTNPGDFRTGKSKLDKGILDEVFGQFMV